MAIKTITGLTLTNLAVSDTLELADGKVRDHASSSIQHIYYVKPSGVAPVTGVSSTLWVVTGTSAVSAITSLVDGMTLSVRVPRASDSTHGTMLDLNGYGLHPVVYNVNTSITSRYGANSTVTVTYNSTQTATGYTNSARTTYTGVWQVNDYDTTSLSYAFQLRHNNGTYVAGDQVEAEKLCVQTSETHLYPISNGASTSGHVYFTGVTFNPFGAYIYCDTKYTSGATIAATKIWQQMNNVDIRYTFNNTITNNKDVYLVAVPQSNGMAKLHTTPITQTLPTSADGKIYIYLGHGCATTMIELHPVHPVYYYKSGVGVIIWNGIEDVTQGELNTVREIAEGKTATYVITGTTAPAPFNSSADTITATTQQITGSASTKLRVGDIVLVQAVDYPDRWVMATGSSYNTLSKMETSKIDLSLYSKKTHTHSIGNTSITPEGTVSSTFNGTAATISGSKSYTPGGTVTSTFSGKTKSLTVSGSYKPEGSVSSSFSGSQATITSKGMYKPEGSVSASFSGKTKTLTVSGYYLPEGTVTQPTFTGTEATITCKGYQQPKGTVSQPTFTGSEATVTSNGLYTPGGSVGQPTFTGNQANVQVTGTTTPSGSVGQPTFTGNQATLTVSGYYKPEGSVSAVRIPSTITSGVTTMSASVNGTVLTLTWRPNGSSSTNALTSVTSVVTGTTTPSFTGTNKQVTASTTYTPSGTVSKPSWTGTEATITSNGLYTPGGTVSKPSWTGTQANVQVTGKTTPSGSVSQPTFTGTNEEHTVTGKTTPSGSVSQPTFTGTNKQVTANTTYQPEGWITSASFNGTDKEVTVTGTTTPSGSVTSTFTGTDKTVTATTSYQPEGWVSSSFSGTAATISISASYTPAGSVTSTFTGTAASHSHTCGQASE